MLDRIIDNLGPILGLLGLLISAWYGPVKVARTQGKNKKEEVKLEGDSHAERLYVENMPIIIEEYKEQVSGFRKELNSVKTEFEEFKKQHEKEVNGYKRQVRSLENSLENKDQEIKDLKGTIKVKEKIIKALKGEA